MNTPIRSSITASKPNDAHVYDAPTTRTNVACLSANHENNVGSMSTDQIDKSSESTYKQQGRKPSHATNPSRAGK